MYIVIFLIVVLFLAWIALTAYLTGYISPDSLPEALRGFALPQTTAELGESLAILNGLSTTIAVLVAFLAIIIQARQTKLTTQMSAYASRLQFLFAEAERLGRAADDLTLQIEQTRSEEKREELSTIRKRSREKANRYRKQAEEIDEKLRDVLPKL